MEKVPETIGVFVLGFGLGFLGCAVVGTVLGAVVVSLLLMLSCVLLEDFCVPFFLRDAKRSTDSAVVTD